MRRLLLPFVLVAAAAVPASAAQQTQICAGVRLRGSVPPNTETTLDCRAVDWQYGTYCETGSQGVHPDAWVEHHYCGPTLIPIVPLS